MGFFRANALQPARQRDSNGVGNRLWFSRIFQKGSSICSVTSANPSGVFSRPLSAPVANPKASAAFGFDSRSQPFCLPYPSNIRGLEKYFHPVIPWFIMPLTSRISHCFGSSPAFGQRKSRKPFHDFLLGGTAGGRLVFSFESSGQGGPKICCLSEHYN